MRFPIGLPGHCEAIILKSNRTTSDTLCPSFCGTNQVSDIPEAPEMAIPENVDIIETSTAFKPQKTATTKLLPIERKDPIELSTTLNESLNHSVVEQTTAKDKLDGSSQGPPVAEKLVGKVNKMAIQAEQPVEVRDSPVLSQNTASPPLQSNYSDKSEPMSSERAIDLVEAQKRQPKTTKDTIDTNVESKQQEIEPLLMSVDHASSTKFLENDIKTTFNKKAESKFEKTLLEDGIEMPKSTNGNIEPLPSYTASSQMIASTPAYGVPVETTNPACLLIYLIIRSESFNITLGSDEICHNFNITYNIPISKYMKENHFKLVFA